MKLFSFLFALIFLFEAFCPCDDADSCKNEDAQELAMDKIAHEHHQEEADMCSPFCLCSCCGMKMAQAQRFTFTALIPERITFIASLRELPAFLFSSNIWQPPRHLQFFA